MPPCNEQPTKQAVAHFWELLGDFVALSAAPQSWLPQISPSHPFLHVTRVLTERSGVHPCMFRCIFIIYAWQLKPREALWMCAFNACFCTALLRSIVPHLRC